MAEVKESGGNFLPRILRESVRMCSERKESGKSETFSGRAAGLIGDALVSPPCVGMCFATVLFVWSLLELTQVSYFGHTSAEAMDFAIRHLSGAVVSFQLRILAYYWAVAVFGGLLAWLILAGRDWVARRDKPPRLRRFVRSFATLGFLHVYFFSRAVVETPELYSQSLYFEGGWRRWFQVTLTHRLGLGVLDALFVILIVFIVFSPFVRRGVREKWSLGLENALWRWKKIRGRRRALILASLPFGVFPLLMAVFAWAFSGPTSSPENEGMNVVILAVDGLRSDAVWGDESKYAPEINAFGRRSVVFTRAYTSLARTFPSWISLLTGRFPHSHSIRHMFPSREETASIGETLPRRLREMGYTTAVVSDYAGEIFARADLGFDHVDVPGFDFSQIVKQQALRVHVHLLPYLVNSFGRRLFPVVDGFPDAADPFELGSRVQKKLRRLSRKRKFFLTAFFSATHFPYASPYPYYRMFTDDSYRGPYKYGKTRMPGEETVTDEDIEQVWGLYRGAVAAVDRAVGSVLQELRRLGIEDRTIVVITADHGETLYEGNLGMGHGDHLRGESALRIPLVVYVPGVSMGKVVSAVVRDVDLAPTLAELTGKPMKNGEGVSLVELIKGVKNDLNLPAFSETGLWFTLEGEGWTPQDRLFYPEVLGGLMDVDAEGGYDIRLKDEYRNLVIAAKHRCVIYENWKLIYRPLVNGVDLQLYDIEKDPLNETDLSREKPEIKDMLWRKLKGWMLEDPNNVYRGGYVLPGQN